MVLSTPREVKTTTRATCVEPIEKSVDTPEIATSVAQEAATTVSATSDRDIEKVGSSDVSESLDGNLSEDESCETDESSGYGSDNSNNVSDCEQEIDSMSPKGAPQIKREVLALLREESNISIEILKRIRKLLRSTPRTDNPSQQGPIRSEIDAKVLKGSSVEEAVKDKLSLQHSCVEEKSSQFELAEDQKIVEVTKRRLEAMQKNTVRPSAASGGKVEDNETNHGQARMLMQSSIAEPINTKHQAVRRHGNHFDALRRQARRAWADSCKSGRLWSRTLGGIHDFDFFFTSSVSHDPKLIEMEAFEPKGGRQAVATSNSAATTARTKN